MDNTLFITFTLKLLLSGIKIFSKTAIKMLSQTKPNHDKPTQMSKSSLKSQNKLDLDETITEASDIQSSVKTLGTSYLLACS